MKQRNKDIILAILVCIVSIAIPSWLLNKWIEGVFFFICHWFIKEQFPYQYHHIVPYMCFLITSSIFFFSICVILPFSLSMFSTLPLCYFIGWVGCKIKELSICKAKIRHLTEPKPFNTNSCSKEELIERCKAVGYGEENIQLAVAFFIDKTKQSVIADSLSIDEKSVQQRKQRMKQKLNRI